MLIHNEGIFYEPTILYIWMSSFRRFMYYEGILCEPKFDNKSSGDRFRFIYFMGGIIIHKSLIYCVFFFVASVASINNN